jgi:uncharacterized protein (UPF0333 family)
MEKNKIKLKNLKKIIRENKAQISLEFLLILGILIIGAIIVGIYLKQTAAKNAQKSKDLQNESLSG